MNAERTCFGSSYDANLLLVKVDKNSQLKENLRAAHSSLAEENGLAVVFVDGKASVLTEANNNSMCRVLYSSEQFAPECDKYCGRAFQMAEEVAGTVAYRCYAGLDCRAVPVKDAGKTRLVAIVGRVFTRAENYRSAAVRAASGDWREFPPDEFFENVLLTGSTANLERVAGDLENLSDEQKAALFATATNAPFRENSGGESGAENEIQNTPQTERIAEPVEKSHGATAQTTLVDNNFTRQDAEETAQIAEWRELSGSLLNLTYKGACASILQFLSRRYNLESPAWLERRENRFEIVASAGEPENSRTQFGIRADNARLIEAARREIFIELRECAAAGENAERTRAVGLLPVAVGGEIRSVLLVGEREIDEDKRRYIARFCRAVASELEILRLHEELARRGWLARAVERFNENVREIDSEDFWLNLARIFAELMRAERSSVMIFDEKSNSLVVKAAIGLTAEVIKTGRKTLGARVAAGVFADGKPLVVKDVEKTEIQSAPPGWEYKSKSFISYPIEIGGRKIGVLNLTDKTGGEDYDEFDLELLHALVPQLAVLIDRADLKHKAREFELMSVTDALTGLLNRRYLEERLTEETKRSNRHGFPMSFMMIDVDDFKSYNDNFSHPEGDRALKLVAQYLKETLRGADITARYGGEEFSILLPQTTSAEARIIAERVRERVDSADFPNRKVTVSIGVASCSPQICTHAEIIRAADEALYQAKRCGRNNVQVYENLKNGD